VVLEQEAAVPANESAMDQISQSVLSISSTRTGFGSWPIATNTCARQRSVRKKIKDDFLWFDYSSHLAESLKQA
jgi:hypothetical protein